MDDFEVLLMLNENLSKFTYKKSNLTFFDFRKSETLKEFNKTILKYKFCIDIDVPEKNSLIPCINSRIDYIKVILVVMLYFNELDLNKLSLNNNIICIDVGTGSYMIYPLILKTLFNIRSKALDINQNSLENCRKILDLNPKIFKNGDVELIYTQKNLPFFDNININYKNDNYDDFPQKNNNSNYDENPFYNFFTTCNPPFFNEFKYNNENKEFECNDDEIIFDGGEYEFILNLFNDSLKIKTNPNDTHKYLFFTSLIGLKSTYKRLKTFFQESHFKNPLIIIFIRILNGNQDRYIIMWKILNKNKEINYQKDSENYCKIFNEKNSEYYRFLTLTEENGNVNFDFNFDDLKSSTESKLKDYVNYYVESTKLIKKDKEKDKYMLINKKNNSISLRFLNKKKRNIRFLDSEF